MMDVFQYLHENDIVHRDLKVSTLWKQTFKLQHINILYWVRKPNYKNLHVPEINLDKTCRILDDYVNHKDKTVCLK